MVLLTFMLSDMPLHSTDEQIKAANNGIRDLIMHYKKLLERESSQDVAEKQELLDNCFFQLNANLIPGCSVNLTGFDKVIPAKYHPTLVSSASSSSNLHLQREAMFSSQSPQYSSTPRSKQELESYAEGSDSICSRLVHMSNFCNIAHLNISGNDIGQDIGGFKLFQILLNSNHSLITLDISNNDKINASGDVTIALAIYLKRNSSLNKVRAKGNKISSADSDTLIDALRHNISITVFEIDCNEEQQQISKILERNRKIVEFIEQNKNYCDKEKLMAMTKFAIWQDQELTADFAYDSVIKNLSDILKAQDRSQQDQRELLSFLFNDFVKELGLNRSTQISFLRLSLHNSNWPNIYGEENLTILLDRLVDCSDSDMIAASFGIDDILGLLKRDKDQSKILSLIKELINAIGFKKEIEKDIVANLKNNIELEKIKDFANSKSPPQINSSIYDLFIEIRRLENNSHSLTLNSLDLGFMEALGNRNNSKSKQGQPFTKLQRRTLKIFELNYPIDDLCQIITEFTDSFGISQNIRDIALDKVNATYQKCFASSNLRSSSADTRNRSQEDPTNCPSNCSCIPCFAFLTRTGSVRTSF